MTRGLSVCAIAAVLAGCQSAAPIVAHEPIEVRVPVPVPCVAAADVPARPPITEDADLARLDDRAAVFHVERERRALAQYARQADALLRGCAR